MESLLRVLKSVMQRYLSDEKWPVTNIHNAKVALIFGQNYSPENTAKNNRPISTFTVRSELVKGQCGATSSPRADLGRLLSPES